MGRGGVVVGTDRVMVMVMGSWGWGGAGWWWGRTG